MINEGNQKEDFIFPIQGIIKCCQLKNDYKLYYEVKEVLYENLKYISSSMSSKSLSSSLFEKDQSLDDFIKTIPKNKKSINNNKKTKISSDLSINVFKCFSAFPLDLNAPAITL